jgi:hypothetical protein
MRSGARNIQDSETSNVLGPLDVARVAVALWRLRPVRRDVGLGGQIMGGARVPDRLGMFAAYLIDRGLPTSLSDGQGERADQADQPHADPHGVMRPRQADRLG